MTGLRYTLQILTRAKVRARINDVAGITTHDFAVIERHARMRMDPRGRWVIDSLREIALVDLVRRHDPL